MQCTETFLGTSKTWETLAVKVSYYCLRNEPNLLVLKKKVVHSKVRLVWHDEHVVLGSF